MKKYVVKAAEGTRKCASLPTEGIAQVGFVSPSQLLTRRVHKEGNKLISSWAMMSTEGATEPIPEPMRKSLQNYTYDVNVTFCGLMEDHSYQTIVCA